MDAAGGDKDTSPSVTGGKARSGVWMLLGGQTGGRATRKLSLDCFSVLKERRMEVVS